MLGLSTQLFDADGAFVLNEVNAANLYKSERRYQRVKTLDGGVVLENRGLFSGDKELSITVKFNDALYSVLPNHTHWFLTTADGCFLMFMAAWDLTTNNSIQLSFEGLSDE